MNFLIPTLPISSTVNSYSKVMEKEKVLYGYLHIFAINSIKVHEVVGNDVTSPKWIKRINDDEQE